jgi:hypothetical protein
MKIANSKPIKPVAKKQDRGLNTNGFKSNPFSGASPFGKKNPFGKRPKFNL